jgi:hypothetical protein
MKILKPTRPALPILAALMLAATGACAQGAAAGAAVVKADGMRMAGGAVEVRGKVIELDKINRVAAIRGPKGRVMDFNVPATVKNFEQVAVGDEIVVLYATAVALALEPVQAGSGIRERVETQVATVAPQGELPGRAGGRKVEILAVIEAADANARTVTVRGAKRSVTLDVPPGVDLTALKPGREVRAVFIEAAVLDVQRHAKP